VLVGPVFTDSNGQPWQMSKGHLEKLFARFPNVDIDSALAEAAKHCASHPEWRRGPSGMFGAIDAWLLRSRETVRTHSVLDDLPELSPEALAVAAAIEAGLERDGEGMPCPVFATGRRTP